MVADIKILVYKPSTIAAAALIFASYELFPQQYSILRSSITACEFIDEVSLYLYLYSTKPLLYVLLLLALKYMWWLL